MLSISIASLSAKGYTIERVLITSEVMKNGDIRYNEKRTYNFSGSFSRANYELSKRGFDSISNIIISENGVEYSQDESHSAGTFSVRNSKNSIDIRWNYEARDEVRTFEISYILSGALIVGSSHAEFYWTYLSNKWEKPTQYLGVQFILPDYVSGDDTKYWVSGASNKMDLKSTDSGFVLTSHQKLTKRDQVMVRTIFPSGLLSPGLMNDMQYSLENVLEQQRLLEIEQSRNAESKLKIKSINKYLAFIIILISFSSWYYFYSKYGVKHTFAKKRSEVLFIPPSNIKPAIAGWLITQRMVQPCHLSATLFDLSRQGYFTIREGELEKRRFGKPISETYIDATNKALDTASLTSYELFLLDFLAKELKISNKMSDIFDSNNATSTKMSKWYPKWSSEVRKYGAQLELIDAMSVKKMKQSMLVQFVLGLITVALLIAGSVPVLIVALGTTAMFLAASAGIQRLTPGGQKLYNDCIAYRRGLKMARRSDFEKSNPDIHMIFAITFGISGKKLDQFISVMKLTNDDLSWLFLNPNPVMGISGITQSLSQVTGSIVSATASFSGTGASAGSAGGGAGGGAS